MTRRNIAIVLALFLLIPFANAQYKLENFTDMNQINSLTEEGDYIWVCTSGGVFKRKKSDGSMVSVFNIQNSGIARNVVRTMYIDFYGNYWFGTYWGGISKFDGSNWETIDEFDGSKIWECKTITEDINGNIWFGLNSGKVVKYDGSNWETIELGANYYVGSILSDDLNNMWFAIAGINGGLWFMDSDENITQIFDPWDKIQGGGIYDLTKDINGNIWMAYYGGAFKYNPTTDTWTDYGSFLPTNVYSIAQDGEGNMWFGTLSGAYKYDGSTFTQYVSGESGDRINMVLDVLCDAQGNVWLGSYNGLAKIDKNAPDPSSDGWTDRIELNAVQSNYVEDIAFLSDGTARMYGQYSYIIKYDPPFFSEHNANDGCGYGWIKDVVKDNNDNTYISFLGYSDHLLKVIKTDPDMNASCYTLSSYIDYDWPSSFVHDLHFDAQNNLLWIATDSFLYYFFPDYGMGGHFDNGTSGIPDHNITGVTTTIDTLWYSMGSSGIGFLDYEDISQTTTFTTADGLPSNYVSDIITDKNGEIWCLPSLNLTHYSGGIFESYSTPLYSTNMEHDSLNNIWMGGTNGATKFNGERMRTFTTDDGLIENYVNNITIDTAGNIWFASGYFGITKLTVIEPVAEFEHDVTCLPDYTTLINTSTDVDTMTRYEWDINNDGSVEYTTKNLTHLFDAPGKYYVKLTAFNDDLSSSIVKEILVLESPEISMDPSGDVSICSGEKITINALIDNYNSSLQYSYLWNTGSTRQKVYTDTSGIYYVTISNGTCETRSDTTTILASEPYTQETICMVTVDSSTNKNLIIWERTEDVGIESYNIYKLYGYNYVPIGNVPFDAKYSYFTDYQSTPDALAARYSMTVVDTCGNESGFSPYHQTIHLGASAGASPNTYVLDWTSYIDESGLFDPEWYYIWAGPEPDQLEEVTSVSGSFTEWNDNDPGDRVYYKIEARKPDACFVQLPDGKKAGSGPFVHSLSNLEDNRVQTDVTSFNDANVSMYPNPMSEWTKIYLNSSINLPARLRIYDIKGMLIRTEMVNDQEIILDRKNLESGFYFIRIDSDKVISGKLLIE